MKPSAAVQTCPVSRQNAQERPAGKKVEARIIIIIINRIRTIISRKQSGSVVLFLFFFFF